MISDHPWMQQALALARRGIGKVHPNPMVGAVVARRGRRIAEGFHERFGAAHAEVNALARAGARAKGATLYVNLEPCSHWGKTPPCVQAILTSGVKEVVVAMKDPNPQVSGRGIRALRRHGIRVRIGACEAEAQYLNRAFKTFITEKRPYVTLKAASSLDGKTATVAGESQWITGKKARMQGHRFRAEVDAVAVGVQTVLHDNPSLTTHGKGRSPLRVIFDSALRTSTRSHVFNKEARTIFFCDRAVPTRRQNAFRSKNVEVCSVNRRTSGLNVREALRILRDKGIAHVLLEGGGRLAASFLEAGRVDEVLWFLAPRIIGGAEARTAVEGAGIRRLAQAWRLQRWSVESVGNDLCIRGFLK